MSSFEKVKDFPILYKKDTKGKVRVWYMEMGIYLDRAAYRTVSGTEDGKKVTSVWKEVYAKNEGKSNATTAHMQAEKEIKSQYTIRSESGYFASKENIGTYDKFEPMLAQDYAKLKAPLDFEAQKIYAQPKLDGIRCIARADGLWTRAGKRIVSIPHIEQQLAPIFEVDPDLIIDGELYNHELKDDFNKITSLVRKTKPTDADIKECADKVEYHVYDMYDEHNPFLEFGTRQKHLNTIVKHIESVVVVPTVLIMDTQHCDDLYADWVEKGYEGQMLRHNTAYECKRSKSLLKRKEFVTEEFVVKSVEEGQGNWSGHIKRFVLALPDGRSFGSGVRGKQAVLKDLFESGVKPDWATIRYFSLTPDGIPRFPVAVDWGIGQRED